MLGLVGSRKDSWPYSIFPVRIVNWIGRHVSMDRLPGLQLTAESLLREAEAASGLSDWGDDSFRYPLQLYLESLRTEANLHLTGRYLFRKECLRLLINRLQLQAALRRQPQILETPVRRPLFVLGLFRSGTSFLHNLLAQDPGSRWLHLAEALYPVPAPEQATFRTDPRISQTESLTQFQNALSPGFSAAHKISALRPAECSRLFEHSMIGHLFDFRANVKTYSDWLAKQELSAAYQDYRRQLQYLGHCWTGSHWVLKAPAHLFGLDALLQAFPDACIVQTHRDPSVALPSCCSLCALGRARYSDDIDLPAIGSHWLQRLSQGVRSALAVRERADSKRFFDVRYSDLVREPLETVRRIYDYFGYPMSPDMVANINAWVAKNQQHKHGVHRYAREQFDLTTDRIEHEFKDYQQRFQIDKER